MSEFHPRVMELPASVQDYVVVHELCHTVEKSHTRAFWALVARQMPDWRRQHEVLERAAFGGASLTGAYGLMQTVISPAIGYVVDRQGFAPVCLAMALLPLLGVSVLYLTRERG